MLIKLYAYYFLKINNLIIPFALLPGTVLYLSFIIMSALFLLIGTSAPAGSKLGAEHELHLVEYHEREKEIVV